MKIIENVKSCWNELTEEERKSFKENVIAFISFISLNVVAFYGIIFWNALIKICSITVITTQFYYVIREMAKTNESETEMKTENQ